MVRLVAGVCGVVAICGLSAGAMRGKDIGASESPAIRSEGVKLSSAWTKGDATSYRFKVESMSTRTMLGDEGGTFTQIYRQEGTLTRRVLATDDKGGATLSIVIDAMKFQVSSGQTVLWYDSAFKGDSTRTNELTEPVLTAVGRPIVVSVDAQGNVKTIEGNQDPEVTNEQDAQRPKIPQAILGDVVVKKVWRPLYGLAGAPAEAPAGGTWAFSDQTVDGRLGIYTYTLNHTLKGVSGSDAAIDMTGDVKFQPAVGPGSIKAELKGAEVRGSIVWDAAKGTLKSHETVQMTTLEGEGGGKRQSVKTTVTTNYWRSDVAAEMDKAAQEAAKNAEKDAGAKKD